MVLYYKMKSSRNEASKRKAEMLMHKLAKLTVLGLAVSLSLILATCGYALEIERVSVDSSGNQGNGASSHPSISADGRYVAFESNATNLVPGDTNEVCDIFVHDRKTGKTTRVSIDSSGEQGNDASSRPSISADGRYVAFQSFASNLVSGDTNGYQDLFVHDRKTHQTTRASLNSSGNQTNYDSVSPSIGADGRCVAFQSLASNLVSGDTNSCPDIFVHDRETGETTRVSVDSSGNQGNRPSSYRGISADGRYIAFQSYSTNLVPGDTNRCDDVFVHDRQTHQTTRVSVDSSKNQGNSASHPPFISADGRHVTFPSHATNLVPRDTNLRSDIFVHDRETHQTTRVSLDSSGNQTNAGSSMPCISADGRFVAFGSFATNLVFGDTNKSKDIFVHDRETGETIRLSVDSSGNQGNNKSELARISADGRYVTFQSLASNLVSGDTNALNDIFVIWGFMPSQSRQWRDAPRK